MMVRSAWWKLLSMVVRRITSVRMTPPVSSPPLANSVLRNRSGADRDVVFSGYSIAAVISPDPSMMAVHGWASTTCGSSSRACTQRAIMSRAYRSSWDAHLTSSPRASDTMKLWLGAMPMLRGWRT